MGYRDPSPLDPRGWVTGILPPWIPGDAWQGSCPPAASSKPRSRSPGCLSPAPALAARRFLFGERPFWWLHESGLSGREQLPLRQFPITCETGPGSPSGHCMILGAGLWPVVTALSRGVSRYSQSRLLKLIPFLVYVLLLVAMGVSRVFVLAHFPHQVVTGSLAGMALGWGLQRWPPNFLKCRFFLGAALGLLLSALALHRDLQTE
ncbi:PREDICTED: glucose-6-phosphatase 3 [Ficedula albicollis]|uniref:glucose-6-phosphatase 3 n=1 Tax=Ficedula albicollis TaxID=59894 RepID=UPI000359D3A9|nr:PREDICTED: glucose-6-phosphatase 3 [Ficedula albicollis]